MLRHAAASVGLATEINFYDEDLPSSLNPLFGTSMVDFRAQELFFDRLYYTDPVTNAYKSRLVNSYEITSTSRCDLITIHQAALIGIGYGICIVQSIKEQFLGSKIDHRSSK